MKKIISFEIGQLHQNACKANSLGYKVRGLSVIDPSGKPVEIFDLDGFPAFIMQEEFIGEEYIFVPAHLLVLWEKYGVQILLEKQIRYKDGNINNFRFENVYLGNWPESLDDFFNIRFQ
ncbi:MULTISPECIES: hypothetical protein [unclassified Paenibacillus]|uniref:hypothetical protein n=1 Tax=unclassified Paenibacillus TaxID=185978 RepID=UPI0024054F19|nr:MULTISPECIES: hypothetical protein [unclassified Paenibacillus]MDF9839063.1 hypothetical protein [Paenibacillus sp. PastF-2]MDF9845645.1 hypothetical protein [Paenibacillus sp. PastM-2]MDF9852217.1 hypothetical protein [Paenibacillus sp. PastF-1]MDH6478054.1 hypothetical protein [Paenibacillus sp. PastH-2]MDH6505789.1 hypothetical protein [Paenibacillus sp. PastM-3]